VFFVSFVVPNPSYPCFSVFNPWPFPPTPIDEPALQTLRQAQAEQLLAPEPPPDIKDLAAQFLTLVTCRDEKDQVELLTRLKEEGRECKALLA
jgi:hypothetical protein